MWFVELTGPETACDCSAFTFCGLQAGKAQEVWQSQVPEPEEMGRSGISGSLHLT